MHLSYKWKYRKLGQTSDLQNLSKRHLLERFRKNLKNENKNNMSLVPFRK